MSRIFDNVRQVGYVTPDLKKSMRFMIERAGIGPWFIAERLTISECVYRGETYDLPLSIAVANSGTLQIELIEPVDDRPSIIPNGCGNIHLANCRTTTHPDLNAMTRCADRQANWASRPSWRVVPPSGPSATSVIRTITASPTR